MNIVRLLNAYPGIRKVFMGPPKEDLQSQDSQESVGEDDHCKDRMNMDCKGLEGVN